MGNPYGLATEGSTCASLSQTAAQSNPRNSATLLFDMARDVIGINTAVILPEKRVNGIGFAMPITPQTIATIHDLKEGTEVVYGYLGVVVSTPTEHERREAGITRDFGVRIDSVEKDSASASGLLHEQD